MADATRDGGALHDRDEHGHGIPPVPQDVIDRRRLLARVAGGFAAGPYVEILAAHGWGKTTLASQYALSRDTPVVWISCASEAPEGGAVALGPLLRAWEDGRDLDVTVVLDDAQELLDDEARTAALRRLVELRPVGVHVLICSTRHLGRTLAGPEGEVACSLITERELRLTARATPGAWSRWCRRPSCSGTPEAGWPGRFCWRRDHHTGALTRAPPSA